MLHLNVCGLKGHVECFLLDGLTVSSLQTDTPLRHDVPWRLGTREDGYLIGLDNLTTLIRCDRERGSEGFISLSLTLSFSLITLMCHEHTSLFSCLSVHLLRSQSRSLPLFSVLPLTLSPSSPEIWAAARGL